MCLTPGQELTDAEEIVMNPNKGEISAHFLFHVCALSVDASFALFCHWVGLLSQRTWTLKSDKKLNLSFSFFVTTETFWLQNLRTHVHAGLVGFSPIGFHVFFFFFLLPAL